MLDSKVAVVTGAGRGLGRSYARAMARAGASVVVNDIERAAALDVVGEIESEGGAAVAVACAVGTSEAAQELVDTAVTTYGRLDAMVTNAGIVRDRTLPKTSDEDFDLVLHTHLRGTFTCGRAALQRFREQGTPGRLILVGSPAGQRASFGQSAYSAAKAAIVGMGRTWALECLRHDVTVNVVVPVALTRMMATVPGMADAVGAADRGEPIPAELRDRGLGSPDDVAALVVFLASDRSAGITGQVIGGGGDRLSLWSQPSIVATANRLGGWSSQEIADSFVPMVADKWQAYALPARKSPRRTDDARSA